MALQILIADDHAIVRKGIKVILEAFKGWKVCGEASSGREAVAKTKRLHPDIVVMDITMPELNGIEATRQIRLNSPETEVLMLSMHESEVLVSECFDAGAKGYALKDDADECLITALNAVKTHQTYISPKLRTKMIPRFTGKQSLTSEGSERTVFERLSPRERETMQLVAEGKNNREIAGILEVTVKTVESHRTRIMRKLKVHSVVDLVRYAIRNKVVGA